MDSLFEDDHDKGEYSRENEYRRNHLIDEVYLDILQDWSFKHILRWCNAAVQQNSIKCGVSFFANDSGLPRRESNTSHPLNQEQSLITCSLNAEIKHSEQVFWEATSRARNTAESEIRDNFY